MTNFANSPTLIIMLETFYLLTHIDTLMKFLLINELGHKRASFAKLYL